MKRAYNKDIWRTIKRSKKRFFAIMMITTLGVTMLTGLKAGCVDLRTSADAFYDEQSLYDIQVVSTFGLTNEDVEALASIKDVDKIEGAYQETKYVLSEDKKQSVAVKTLSKQGMNEPYLLEGRFPQVENEIVVSEKYLRISGKAIGDSIQFEETNTNDSTNLKINTFVITGSVLDPMNISVDEGAASFRSTSTIDDTFFVLPEAYTNEIYTSIYITLKDSKDLLSYSDTYEQRVKEVITYIEAQIKAQREQARDEEIQQTAWAEYTASKQEAEDGFALADEAFLKAQQQLQDGMKQLQNAKQEILANEQMLAVQKEVMVQQFDDAYSQLHDGYLTLFTGKEQITTQKQSLLETEIRIEEAKQSLKKQEQETEMYFDTQIAKLQTSLHTMQLQHQMLEDKIQKMMEPFGKQWPDNQWKTLQDDLYQTYLPIASLSYQIEQWKQQLSSSEDTNALIEKITQAGIALETLKANAAKQYEGAKNTFLQTIQKETTAILQMLNQQIAHLDKTNIDYEIQLKQLQQQKQDVQALPQQILQAAIDDAILTTNITISNTTIKTLQQQYQASQMSITAAWETLHLQETQVVQGKQQLQEAEDELSIQQEFLQTSMDTFILQKQNAYEKLAQGEVQLVEGAALLQEKEQELQLGQEALEAQISKYEVEKQDAYAQLADAQNNISTVDKTKWYIQDRSSIDSYASIDSDATSIEAVGTAFPIVFLAVAILISLTTITRMVEEERGLIGTYKALGFSDYQIYGKYVLYAFSACFLGGILGDICGFILLPKFLFTIFQVLYKLPYYQIGFDVMYGIGGILLFVIGIIIATLLACRVELVQMPAVLMRPKAPRAGSRVFLEHISILWKNLTFLNKVTMRNLFRYKKRMFMTISGIMGCTALLLCGCAIKDSVTELMPAQYERIYQYDFMTVVTPNAYNRIKEELIHDENIKDMIGIRIDSMKVKTLNGEHEESVQLMVIPDDVSISGYIGFEDINGQTLSLEDGIYITQNASQIMGFSVGDTILLQNMDLIQKEVEISTIVQNYLGNTMYMKQSVYEKLFTTYEANGFLAHFSSQCDDQIQYAQSFGQQEDVLSSISVANLKSQFKEAFTLIHAVVYLITVMAAGLAFVVLFTLSTTNISERERELATIKVLGFFDKEVHLYVNKETLILTCLGILCGLPLGRILSGMLTSALNMPAIHFAVCVYPISYVYAAMLSFLFALIVNAITNRTLNTIDMVEALKSME